MDGDELEALRAEVARLTERVLALEDLQDAVAQLADMLHAEQPTTTPETEAAVWVELDGEHARGVLDGLRLWMSTVLVHYPRVVGTLRPCWYRHPAAVQSLLDVRSSWLAAYRGSGGGLDWASRDLASLEEHLAREMSRCTSVAHDPARVSLPELDEFEVDRYLQVDRRDWPS